MKYYHLATRLLLAAALLGLAGCNEEEKVGTPDFAASASGTVFKVGEPVEFALAGNPDFIVFYSGEPGNAYDYRDRDRIEKAETTLSFLTQTKAGIKGNANPRNAPVFYSTDFDGTYTEESVDKATWTDLSDRFVLPTDTEQSVPAGTLYIDGLFPEDGSPIYLLYDYHVAKYTDSKKNGRTQVDIMNFNINGITPAGTTTIYNLKNAGFQFVFDAGYRDNNKSQEPDVNTSRIMLRTDYKPTADMRIRAVSGPLYRPDDVNSGPDGGVGIKAVADPTMKSFHHTYDKPGEYTVTFVASNSNVYGRKDAVRELRITVVNDTGTIEPPVHDEWSN
ncbi:DUF5017 domain-containing protein [Alistipes sp. UBA6068]|uniref:DUF5017 domain-containing protein n=1 Tax=Alistipes sp. UBA6068 TaxID=1946012 RepID=UPI00259642A5|nr:DUF5017 domain-containing protein [Alistipes sp. UBA6068]